MERLGGGVRVAQRDMDGERAGAVSPIITIITVITIQYGVMAPIAAVMAAKSKHTPLFIGLPLVVSRPCTAVPK